MMLESRFYSMNGPLWNSHWRNGDATIFSLIKLVLTELEYDFLDLYKIDVGNIRIYFINWLL